MFRKNVFIILGKIHSVTRNTLGAFSIWVQISSEVWMEPVPWCIFVLFKLLILDWLKVRTPFRFNLRKHLSGIGPLCFIYLYVDAHQLQANYQITTSEHHAQ